MTVSSLSAVRVAALRSALEQAGYRLTPQRYWIAEIFEGLAQGEHLSAIDLQRHLSDRQTPLSKSTIYRSLESLCHAAWLRCITLDRKQRCYELNREGTHYHLTCLHCQAVIEFLDDRVIHLSEGIADRYGFQLLNCQLLIMGICAACRY
ncbi:Fur family transcriptional regulator [Synechococcus elongatus]|uniref:Ferric uptake regulator, FUR family n=2 Tax=Synechococcus elongatus TaxID=32046 RepID=Q31L69_SYNE7|nr:transcriptional repressor [Synechococcus elongatus]MBD2687994.1 transcriptional repressor [Synechococcus elongatus FACHB-1061]ABB58200.1 putative ferric uptake regulator, FUR family [Synechococcus elongatus PCC 7942 = FACHB-805]AJD57325.1 Fur family transcriptional regulator [Synechococcus elongatus UTEX 2973]MBD2586923.1 transcriptional repressor [Synechococcus elongatus FACHB-242]MBD2706295.1 transcriptional repressor [Synechococcus elongatus PCC 7942 = FACHB-805]